MHKNPWWQVRCDDFSMPSGKRGKYYILETKGSVYIVAIKSGLKFVGEERESTEEMQTLEIEIGEVFAMAESGKITDGMTLAALAIARPHVLVGTGNSRC